MLKYFSKKIYQQQQQKGFIFQAIYTTKLYVLGQDGNLSNRENTPSPVKNKRTVVDLLAEEGYTFNGNTLTSSNKENHIQVKYPVLNDNDFHTDYQDYERVTRSNVKQNKSRSGNQNNNGVSSNSNGRPTPTRAATPLSSIEYKDIGEASVISCR